MNKKRYPSDLTDAEWMVIAPLIPPAKPGGRPRTVNMREVLNGIFYVLRTGCPWRYMPHDLPNWMTCYMYYRRFCREGVWERINAILRQEIREKEGRHPDPSEVIIDSQSAKTTEQGGPRGYDAGKKVRGRKRHMVVDTLGLMVLVWVHAAHIQDRTGAREVLQRLGAWGARLRVIWADGGYAGELQEWARKVYGWRIEIVKKIAGKGQGFCVLPHRWVVERTFAWINRNRRLAKDYERLPLMSEGFVYAAMVRLMMRRLTCTNT